MGKLKAAEQAGKEKGHKEQNKMKASKKHGAVSEAKKKASLRVKYLDEATVMESKLKTEAKDKQQHYQNLFRAGMRFKHLLNEMEKTTDQKHAAQLKAELHKIEKSVPHSYVKRSDPIEEKMAQKALKKEEDQAKKQVADAKKKDSQKKEQVAPEKKDA